MDLRDSIRPVLHYWWAILLCVVLAFGGLIVTNKMQSISYDGAVTLFVKQVFLAPEKIENYKYDGYYAVMANQTFADTLEIWLKSPEIVAEIYEKAGINYPSSMSGLTNLFDVDKSISQSVAVKINIGSEQEAALLLKSATDVIKERVEKYLVNSEGQPIFTIDSSKILVLRHEIDYQLQFAIGFMGAISVGIFLAYFMYAISEEREDG